MGNYIYRAYSGNGDELAGELEAQDISTAKHQLLQRGLLLLEIHESDTTSTTQILNEYWFKLTPPKPDKLQIAEFIEFLGILLSSGLDMEQCLKLSGEQASSSLRPVIEKLRTQVTSGKSLSLAMETQSKSGSFAGILPKPLIAIIKAGETSGQLADALTDYARATIERQKIYAEITASMIYPAIILIMSVVAIGVIAVFLVPAFLPIFEQSGASLPIVISLLASLSKIVSTHKLLLALVFLLGLIVTATMFKSKSGLQTLQTGMVGLPLIGQVLKQSEQSKIFGVLGILLNNKVELIAALEISAQVSFLGSLQSAMNRACNNVREGRKFSQSMQDEKVFSQLACRMIAIGEQTNRLGPLLTKLSDIQAKQVKMKLDKFVIFLTPIITITMGMLIGTLMIGTMQAILSINELSL